MEKNSMRKLALITGASTGIGFELASIAAEKGYDLLVAADERLINAAAADFVRHGVDVIPVEADLSSQAGVDIMLRQLNGRPIDVLCANAGIGAGGAFLEQDFGNLEHSVNTNITGTIYLLQEVLKQMVKSGKGKVLVTGSIAGYIPGSFNAVYNASKAFIDNFTDALRNELKDVEGVTLTTLMPGATDTEFFARAGMLDTKVGTNEHKDDPAKVARDGWNAMIEGQDRIIPGWHNKLQVAASGVAPAGVMAEMHRKIAEPGSAK
jgi:uncharacterized protein